MSEHLGENAVRIERRNDMKNEIKFVALVSALLSIQKMNADTNDTYTVQDMFQTVVTPTEFSTTQSQHDQLPDILTMPKLDKEALYLFYKELDTDYQKMILVRRQFMQRKNPALLLDWEDRVYSRYSDGLLEFDFYASKEGDPKKHYHVFQDKTGKFYENTPPTGNRTLVKKWYLDKRETFGTITDYKNNIKWSGVLTTIAPIPAKETFEFTEITKIKDKEHRYDYKAEFSCSPKLFNGETKFKTTHISTVDGKSSKPIITETVYKGLPHAVLNEMGYFKGIPPIRTFKTIRD